MTSASATYRIVDPRHYDGPLTIPPAEWDHTVYVVMYDRTDFGWTSRRADASDWCNIRNDLNAKAARP